ncbi:polysaccharide pyruvyl transferase family protein [Weissella sp. MSCH1]|uniref:polysaccharide pyruvyl transferase family protein n=1 Tax=Weissella sp. MSCH1 TaxID=3383343 RepID=UPI003896ACBE
MKLGIVTLGGYWNYGNRLQNLALKHVLETKFGCECVTVKHWQHSEERNYKQRLKKIILFIKNRSEFIAKSERTRNFKKFSSIYLNEQKKISDLEGVIVGSDQVWNPTWLSLKQFQYFMLKNFQNVKKISYAASIGINSMPEGYEKILRQELPNFKAVSVRENSASELVDQIVGIKPQVVLDPTMLLTSEEWKNLLDLDIKHKQTVFKYVLGQNSQNLDDFIDELATAKGLEILEYHSLDKDSIGIYSNNPIQFVEDIASASVVVTDSFHAAVFSIIFGVPFVIADRIDSIKMSSRIDTLLDSAGISARRFSEIENQDAVFNVDFSHVETNLKDKKNKSLEFLRSNLSMASV